MKSHFIIHYIGFSKNNLSSLALLVALAVGMLNCAAQTDPSQTTPSQTDPSQTAPSQAATFNVRDYGAVGDGVTLNTASLQKAIDDCSAHGGGVLDFPEGRYLTGTIEIKDNVTLHFDAQAVLLGSTNAADYRDADPFTDAVGGKRGYALVIAVGAKHFGIEGPGEINGQGKALSVAQVPYTIRPFLIRWVRCTDVVLKNITLRDPGAWTTHFFQCQNVTASGVTIRSRDSRLANNDGFDIDSCQTVRIADCDIQSGDDALCIKATSTEPCRDITITNCKLQTFCNALKLGTESLGDFEDIHASHCEITHTGLAGIALYTVDGAHLHDVTITDITIDGVGTPISVRLGARLKTFRPGDLPRPPGTLSDISIKNVHAINARDLGIIVNGIPGHAVENLTLENIQIELAGGGKAQDTTVKLPEKENAYPEMNMFGRVMPAYGLYLRHVHGLTLTGVSVSFKKTDLRTAMICSDIDGLQIDNFNAQLADGVVPAQFDNVNQLVVKDSPVLESVDKQ